MKLHEYQAKELLASTGIPVYPQFVTTTAAEAETAARQLGETVVVKAQVLVGGRGKAGGVKLARNPEEARRHAENILGMDIKGLKVEKVLVTTAADIETECYLGFILDRSNKSITLMLTADGGVDIEELAESQPEKIIKLPFDAKGEGNDAELSQALQKVFATDILRAEAKNIVQKMITLFVRTDSNLLEINPLAIVGGHLKALDAKMVMDDNALFRQESLLKYKNPEESSADEEEAKKAGLSFVSMDGDIGCIVNGAGLAMATMDIIKYYGGNPANFLDVGGSSNPEKVVTAMKIILRNPQVKAILLNIFGGITRCDDIARGLLIALDTLSPTIPLVIRLIGTNQKEGRALLEEKGLAVSSDLDESVQKIVELRQKL